MLQHSLRSMTVSLFVLSFFLSPLLIHAEGSDTHLQATVDGYTAELSFPEGPVKQGSNTVLLRLRNPEGQPTSQATVLITPIALRNGETEEHGHIEANNENDPDSSVHDVAGASAHITAPTHGSADASGESHGDTHQLEASSKEHGHSDAYEASPSNSSSSGLTQDEANELKLTAMTQLDVGVEVGTYTNVISFDSPGTWQITVHFTDQSDDHTLVFAVVVPELPRDWRLLGGFGAVNALIIVTAAVLKRRSSVRPSKRLPGVQAT